MCEQLCKRTECQRTMERPVKIKRQSAIKRQQGEQQGSCVCLLAEEAALHPTSGVSCPDELLHLWMIWPWEQTESACAAGTLLLPVLFQGTGRYCCMRLFERLRARQICQRVQCESQPASIRALNHDSVYADRLKEKLFRCNTQYGSQNSLLWSH